MNVRNHAILLIGCILSGCTSTKTAERQQRRIDRTAADLALARDVMKAEYDLLDKLDTRVEVLEHEKAVRALHGQM